MAVITPDTFDPLHRYVGVRLQQGVPIVDADWNELEDVRKFELRAFLKWFVGDGVPEGNTNSQNDGFRIEGDGSANDFIITSGTTVLLRVAASTGDTSVKVSYAEHFNVDNKIVICGPQGSNPQYCTLTKVDHDPTASPPLTTLTFAGDPLQNAYPIPGSTVSGADALSLIGRCLIDGQDVMIEWDIRFTDQRLHQDNPESDGEQARLGPGIPKITRLGDIPPTGGTVVAYLDVWERLVTTTEDPGLVHSGLGTESCARIKREWVVRVRSGQETPKPSDGPPDYLPGHRYYALATIARRAGDDTVNPGDVTDVRERRLLLPPATLITDLFGTDPADYRRGQGRPPISLREAINALMRGELPSTPDAAIAPDPGQDFMSYAFNFDATGGVIAVWHSRRVAGINQIFATRWDPTDPAAGFATPPQQVTTSTDAHALPHAVLLPTGEVLVVYETAQQDIHFKHASLSSLNAATEEPIAETAGVAERHPFAVVSGNQITFFWHQGTPNPRWMYRRRQYTATWLEADATWVDTTGQELSSTNAAPPSLSVGDFHAAVDSSGDTWIAFRTQTDDIQALRLTPGGGIADEVTLSTGGTDEEPLAVIDGDAAVWVFWRSGSGVHYQRFMRDTSSWETAPSTVPDTNVGTNNSRPCAVREEDGAIWLFWTSDRGGVGNDLWFVRRNPLTGGWGQARQITGSPADDNQPFAALAPNGVLWLFWRSNRSGDYDLYFKQIVTAI